MSLKFRLLAANFEKLTLGTNPSEKKNFFKGAFLRSPNLRTSIAYILLLLTQQIQILHE